MFKKPAVGKNAILIALLYLCLLVFCKALGGLLKQFRLSPSFTRITQMIQVYWVALTILSRYICSSILQYYLVEIQIVYVQSIMSSFTHHIKMKLTERQSCAKLCKTAIIKGRSGENRQVCEPCYSTVINSIIGFA